MRLYASGPTKALMRLGGGQARRAEEELDQTTRGLSVHNRRRAGMGRQRRRRRRRGWSASPGFFAVAAAAVLCLAGRVAGSCEYSTFAEEGGESHHEVSISVSHSFVVPPSDDHCPQGEPQGLGVHQRRVKGACFRGRGAALAFRPGAGVRKAFESLEGLMR